MYELCVDVFDAFKQTVFEQAYHHPIETFPIIQNSKRVRPLPNLNTLCGFVIPSILDFVINLLFSGDYFFSCLP